MNFDIENQRLRKYLLGTLTKAEAKNLDHQLFSNPACEEDFEIAENILIEDFLEGKLNESETTQFFDNFLVSEERIRRFKSITGLKSVAARNFGKQRTPSKKSDPKKSFFNRVAETFHLSPARAVLAAVVIGIIFGIAWFAFFAEQSATPLELEYARMNSDVEKIENLDQLSKVVLFTNDTRGGSVVEKSARNPTQQIFFNLALRTKPKAGEKFSVELLADQKTIFTQRDLVATQNPFGGELKFVLPREILKTGEHRLKVTNDSGKVLEFYSFSVK